MQDTADIEFHTELNTQAVDLAIEFAAFREVRPNNWELEFDFIPDQKYIFLEFLISIVDEVSVPTMERIEECYHYTESTNKELLYRWY